MARVTKFFELHTTGDKIPAIAFGSGTKWQWRKRGRGEEAAGTLDHDLLNVISTALKSGFRHVDTAEVYTTRAEIGEAINNSGIDRSEIWLTDKYNPGWKVNGQPHKANSDGPYNSLVNGLKEMKLDYVDLFLIHSPFFSDETSGITVEEAWKQMEILQEKGLAKNIGVSNFNIEMLEKIFKICKIKPQVNQIEFHCYLQNQSPNIINFCKENNILIEAFSPLSPILPNKAKDKGSLDSIINELSLKYNITETQLILLWVYKYGILPVTTTSNESRMIEILKIFEIELSDEDFNKITEIGKKYHFRGFFHDYFGDEQP
ncbi:2-dehydropantolactone reductase (A-specific) activity protein [[Candida] boidinii]|nr:2-dehydropantolactone reductase (A-specific) activity protein [[Candida] boidinii]